jgi:hypothetical protein
MKQKQQNALFLTSILILMSILFSACRPIEPTIDINAERTGFAQTAMVQGTMTAQAQPTTTNTSEPPSSATPTQEVTATTPPTATPSYATTEVTISGEDAGVWLANDPPDNTEFAPGEVFTITWTLENTGTSTWTNQYYIMFSSGEQMDAEEKIYLPYDVPPGTNVKISVDFIAPESEGEKRSNWQLVNANDEAFYEFYVIIKVAQDEN